MDELKLVFILTKNIHYFLIACRKYHNQVNLYTLNQDIPKAALTSYRTADLN